MVLMLPVIDGSLMLTMYFFDFKLPGSYIQSILAKMPHYVHIPVYIEMTNWKKHNVVLLRPHNTECC